jgi:exonuclease III
LTAATGDGLKRIDFRTLIWDVAFAQYIKQLETEKHVIFAGDLNAVHEVTQQSVHIMYFMCNMCAVLDARVVTETIIVSYRVGDF